MGDKRRLKRCSTSTTTTDVEVEDDYETQKQQKKQKKSDLEKVEPKKQKKSDLKKEMKKLRKSFKEMTKTMKELQETLQTKTVRPEISFKIENPKKEAEPLYECNFASEEPWRNNERTLLVKGFDTQLPRDDIKRALSEHFSSCGEVIRVYVPVECLRRVSIGYAFVDMKEDSNKALKLSGSLLGGFKLMVMIAMYSKEYIGYDNYKGCPSCAVNVRRGIRRLYDKSRRRPSMEAYSRKPDFLKKETDRLQQ